jgi:hypothetical protein
VKHIREHIADRWPPKPARPSYRDTVEDRVNRPWRYGEPRYGEQKPEGKDNGDSKHSGS